MVPWAALNTEPRSTTAEGGCPHIDISPGEQLPACEASVDPRPLALLPSNVCLG